MIKLHKFLKYKYCVTEIYIATCLLPSRILGLVKANCTEQACLKKLTIPDLVKKFHEFNRKDSCCLVFTAAYHLSIF